MHTDTDAIETIKSKRSSLELNRSISWSALDKHIRQIRPKCCGLGSIFFLDIINKKTIQITFQNLLQRLRNKQ